MFCGNEEDWKRSAENRSKEASHASQDPASQEVGSRTVLPEALGIGPRFERNPTERSAPLTSVTLSPTTTGLPASWSSSTCSRLWATAPSSSACRCSAETAFSGLMCTPPPTGVISAIALPDGVDRRLDLFRARVDLHGHQTVRCRECPSTSRLAHRNPAAGCKRPQSACRSGCAVCA